MKTKVESLKARYREVQRNPYLHLIEALDKEIERAINRKESMILLDLFKETRFGEEMWISSDRDESRVTDMIKFLVINGQGNDEKILVETIRGGLVSKSGEDYVFLRIQRKFIPNAEDESNASEIVLEHLRDLDINITVYPITRTHRGETQLGIGVRLSWEHWSTI